MKKFIIVNSSPRKGGNSDCITDLAVKELTAAGAEVEVFKIREKKVGNCIACNSCKATDVCVQKDDAADLIEKATKADGILFVNPVYFGQMTGTMKTLLDRFYVLFNPAKGMKAPSAERKCGIILTFGSMPEEKAAKASEAFGAYAGVAGYGDLKVALCGGQNPPDAFLNSPENQAKVMELLGWIK